MMYQMFKTLLVKLQMYFEELYAIRLWVNGVHKSPVELPARVWTRLLQRKLIGFTSDGVYSGHRVWLGEAQLCTITDISFWKALRPELEGVAFKTLRNLATTLIRFGNTAALDGWAPSFMLYDPTITSYHTDSIEWLLEHRSHELTPAFADQLVYSLQYPFGVDMGSTDKAVSQVLTRYAYIFKVQRLYSLMPLSSSDFYKLCFDYMTEAAPTRRRDGLLTNEMNRTHCVTVRRTVLTALWQLTKDPMPVVVALAAVAEPLPELSVWRQCPSDEQRLAGFLAQCYGHRVSFAYAVDASVSFLPNHWQAFYELSQSAGETLLDFARQCMVSLHAQPYESIDLAMLGQTP